MLTLTEAIDIAGDESAFAARFSPGLFARHVSRGKWQAAVHLQAIDAALLDLFADPDARGLLVNIPPQHGKSQLISRYLPAWYLGTYPDARVLLASYEADFAAQHSAQARSILRNWGSGLFRVRLSDESRAAYRWDLAGSDGGMFAAGVGGAFTGRGADLFVIDDPVKNAEEAQSITQRNKQWEWFLSVVETRLASSAKMILIQTRWHRDDLAGRVLAEIHSGVRRGWRALVMPAIAEGDSGADPTQREPGTALWPARFPLEWLEEKRKRWDSDEARLGPYWFDALYQQRPAPKGGGILKREWFQYGRELPEEKDKPARYELEGNGLYPVKQCWCFQTVDLAVSLKEAADYTVICTWAVGPRKELILIDRARGHWGSPEQKRQLKEQYLRHRPAFVSVESVAYQLALVQDARHEGIPALESKPRGDKVARAQAFAARMEAGMVWFLREVPELGQLETELTEFPAGAHDDTVDCCSMAAYEVARRSKLKVA
jgi:predicted phage terminase large subunit-like protein